MTQQEYPDVGAAVRPLPDLNGPGAGPVGSGVFDWMAGVWHYMEIVVGQVVSAHQPGTTTGPGVPREPVASNAVLLAVVAVVVAVAALGMVVQTRRRVTAPVAQGRGDR